MKYSVIIPVYNAETTLGVCLDSLLTQNSESVEIILVNDGSVDNSAEICQEYAKRYDCVRYAEQPNAGVSSARNRGLDIAVGKYILFVDSDDSVTYDYFQVLDKLTAEHDYDLFHFSSIVDNGHKKKKRLLKNANIFEQKDTVEYLTNAICNKRINTPCDKIYKKEIIDKYQIRFSTALSIGEDKLFNFEYALHTSTCKVSDKILYIINVKNANSLSRKKRQDLQEQFALVEKKQYSAVLQSKLSNTYKKKFLDALNYCEIRSVYTEAKRLHRDNISVKERKEIIITKCKQVSKKSKSIPKKILYWVITIPVRQNLWRIIDLVALRLIHR